MLGTLALLRMAPGGFILPARCLLQSELMTADGFQRPQSLNASGWLSATTHQTSSVRSSKLSLAPDSTC